MGEFINGKLTGPSKKKDQVEALLRKAEWHREQMKQLTEEARVLVKGCKHEFDDGSCSTENLGLIDICVICGC